MRLLVITNSAPAQAPFQKQGISHRLGLFLDGFAALGADITMAQLVLPDIITVNPDMAQWSESQSAYWGLPVKIVLLPRRARRETVVNHYLSGMISAAEQPHMFSFAGPEQAEAVGQLLDGGSYDVVFVQGLPAMCALLRSGRRPGRMFFDLNDLEHKVRARVALAPPRWPGKLAYLTHVPALLAAELKATRAARLTFVCSALDRAHMARFGFGGRIAVVPNAVAVPPAPPPLPAEPTLLFLGACDYLPNAVAAERFATRIVPLIRREMPQATGLVAGRGSDTLPSASNPPENVRYLGFVPDLDALYARSRVICCPIETGGGTRVKLIEAAGYARPMVSTSIGAEGLDFRDGQEILLAESDTAMAAACLKLLRDDELARSLGQAARRAMQHAYDAATITASIAGLVKAEIA